MTLPAFAVEHHAAAPAVDRYLLSAAHSAANLLHAAVDRWDRQTDAPPFHKPCCSYYTGSVNNTIDMVPAVEVLQLILAVMTVFVCYYHLNSIPEFLGTLEPVSMQNVVHPCVVRNIVFALI